MIIFYILQLSNGESTKPQRRHRSHQRSQSLHPRLCWWSSSFQHLRYPIPTLHPKHQNSGCARQTGEAGWRELVGRPHVQALRGWAGMQAAEGYSDGHQVQIQNELHQTNLFFADVFLG